MEEGVYSIDGKIKKIIHDNDSETKNMNFIITEKNKLIEVYEIDGDGLRKVSDNVT